MSDQKTAVAKTLRTLLDQSESRIADVLPKHMDATRVIRLANLSINKTPKLLECDQLSVVAAVLDSARLGLEIGRECHLVPYNTKRGMMAQLIPDYKGIVKLVHNSGVVKSIDARVVRKGDVFAVQYGSTPQITHIPKFGGKDEDREAVAYYSVAFLGPDAPPKIDVMETWEVEAIRQRSRAKDSGPWVTDPDEMGKKTVLKRNCKQIPQSSEVAEVIELDNRYESGRVSSFLEGDTPAAITAAATAATEEAAEDLRERLEEQAMKQNEEGAESATKNSRARKKSNGNGADSEA